MSRHRASRSGAGAQASGLAADCMFYGNTVVHYPCLITSGRRPL